jgi:hypothetical protein
MLDFTACVVCRSVVGERLGREDAQVCNALRSAEGLGWGDRLGWEELFVVHEEERVCWYLVNLGSCWVAPLEVCTGIAMVTEYGCVFWGPVVNCVVVEMPRALGVLMVMEVQIWVQM